MPLHYLRTYTTPQRSDLSNRRLGRSLAFVAGAVNAGGFFAVGQYTSHMSGVVSAMADNLVLGNVTLLLAGAASLTAFFGGAAVSALLINWGRRRDAHSRYALPLLLEAALLLAFGLLGAELVAQGHIGVVVALLCFVMGLQNAIVTKASRAEIRTTHVTGLVTDIGIELGKLSYVTRDHAPGRHPVVANLGRLSIHGRMVGLFFIGGIFGALGFGCFGFGFSAPLAAILIAVVLPVLMTGRPTTNI